MGVATAAGPATRPASRVVFDGRYLIDRYHGIGRAAYGLLRAVIAVADGYEMEILVDPRERNTRFDLDALTAGGRSVLRPARIGLLGMREQLALPALLAHRRANLYHSPYVIAPLFAPVPVVVTAHDLIIERYPDLSPERGLRRRAFVAMVAASLYRASAILAVSAATAADVAEWQPPVRRRIRVARNGVDPGFRREEDPGALRDVRDRYRLPARYVLALGAGRPHKNVELLVEAVAVAGEALADVQLVVAGEHDDRFPDAVGELVTRHGLDARVRRIGRVADGDLAAIFSMAEVFAFPSRIEGFGLPILEAMACGTPVIAARTSSLPEVGGEAAAYVSPDDPHEMARAIETLLREPEVRARMVAAGLERVSGFGWEATARVVVATWNRVLRRQRAAASRAR